MENKPSFFLQGQKDISVRVFVNISIVCSVAGMKFTIMSPDSTFSRTKKNKLFQHVSLWNDST